MFSRTDYIRYFLQVKRVETTMHDKFLSYARAVDSPELKIFFLRMAHQEKAHATIVDGMMETFGYKEGEDLTDNKEN